VGSSRERAGEMLRVNGLVGPPDGVWFDWRRKEDASDEPVVVW